MRLRFIFCVVWAVAVPLVLFVNFSRLNSLSREVAVRTAADGVAEKRVDAPVPNREPQVGKDVDCRHGATSVGCGKYRCCWHLRGDRIHVVFTDDPWPQWHTLEALQGSAVTSVLPVRGSPLFQLFPAREGREPLRPLGTSDCELQHVSLESPLAARFTLFCGEAVAAEFSAILPSQGAHYLRFTVKLWARKASSWPPRGFERLRLFQFDGPVKASVTRVVDNSELMMDPLDGLPLLVEDHFFVGVEHPMSSIQANAGEVNKSHWNGIVGDITHISRLTSPTQESPWQYGGVFGTYAESSQARRAFVQYLHGERPGRRNPMVHYNSWYDFYSYQDEGFNGGFKDEEQNPELIGKLRLDPMKEESCVQRVEAFGTELVRKRNATIDSFLWDDGWDDPQTLWEFDKKRFPNRFDKVASTAASFGSGTGVWLSPWGGYGFPQEARVKYGKTHGFETNLNERLEQEAFSLAGPKYRKAFTDTALKFVREEGVNMFKFDGVAGDPHELAVEMEAMLGLIKDLRSLSTTQNAARRHTPKERQTDKDKDSIWINLTTGTWASPFFLLWADSIWRGGPDIASRMRDWEPDIEYWRARRGPGRPDDGLSRRQRWIRWRNIIVYVLVVRQSMFFPLSQLMIHGVIVASHGDALHWGLHEFDPIDFAQEVWSFVALGLQLQELYVAPRYMTSEAWDILAEGLQWARREGEALRDSHWAFGDPTERHVYCVASWDVVAARGFIFVHNPVGDHRKSEWFRLRNVLELPDASAKVELHLRTVKSIARTSKAWTDRVSGRDRQYCGESLLKCTIAADQEIFLTMLPGEVLVLAVGAASPAAGNVLAG